MKLKFFIDWHKGITFAFILILMGVFAQWENTTAWIYLALHGTYGILWVFKSRIYPDKSWDQPVSWAYGIIAVWGGLTLYWIPVWLILSNSLQAPSWLLGLAVSMTLFGVFFHFASDMQKHTHIRLKPGELITDGFFTRVRNINYFGELLIYAAFASLAMTWIAFIPLLLFIFFYWAPNMGRKERSLSRYDEFEAYRARSKLFIPFLL